MPPRYSNRKKATGWNQYNGSKKQKPFNARALMASGDTLKDHEKRASTDVTIDSNTLPSDTDNNPATHTFALVDSGNSKNSGVVRYYEPVSFAHEGSVATAHFTGVKGYMKSAQLNLVITAKSVPSGTVDNIPLLRVVVMKLKGNNYVHDQHPIDLLQPINRSENDGRYFVLYDQLYNPKADDAIIIKKYFKINNQMQRSKHGETSDSASGGEADRDRDTERYVLWIMSNDNDLTGTAVSRPVDGNAAEIINKTSIVVRGAFTQIGYDF
tara:strand:+ start:3554 stop:4360 length:807 start_codon:yes stop_codon:yes gene_type:complete